MGRSRKQRRESASPRRPLATYWALFFLFLSTATGQSGRPTLIFPQIADGGGIRSELLLTNPGSQEDSGTIEFKDGDGQAMELVIDGTPQASVDYTIRPAGSFELRTDGSGIVKAGYAIVSSEMPNSAIQGTIVYNLNGFEVSVASVDPSNSFHVFVDRGLEQNSGVAFANISAEDAVISAVLFDDSGAVHGDVTLDLPSASQLPRFIDQLFGDVPEIFKGSLHVYSQNEFTFLGLRQRINGSLALLSGSGAAFPTDFGAVLSDDDQIGLLSIHGDGEQLFALTKRESPETLLLEGLIWTSPDGGSLTLFLDENGRPDRAVAGETIFVFDNYTGTTVDVGVISPEGQIAIARDLPIDLSNSEILEVSLIQGAGFSSTLASILKEGWFLAKAVGCVAGTVCTLSTVTTGCGFLAAKLTIDLCESVVAQVVIEVLKENFPGDALVMGLSLTYSEKACARGSVIACADIGINDVAVPILESTEAHLEANNDLVQETQERLAEGDDTTSCPTPAPTVLPVPTNLGSPDSGTFGVPFTFSWDHVWQGCGGYEAEWRRAGSSAWTSVEVSTSVCQGLPRCSVEITIPESSSMSHALRVRSFWGTANDQREHSDWAQGGPGANIEMSP